MTPYLSSTPQRALFVLAALGSFAAGFMPLFEGPSYEFSLLCGATLPTLGALLNALDAARRAPTLERSFFSGLISGLALCALVLSLSSVHGLRVGLCDPWQQHAYFLLGPVPGILLGCVWGASCGAIAGLGVGKRWAIPLAITLAIAAPLLGILASLGRYYTSPIIFAFDHFFGYFSGAIYDTELDGLTRLLSYRAGTLGWLLCLYVLSRLVLRSASGGLVLHGSKSPALLAMGGLGLALVVGVPSYGTELGHHQTVASIHAALGHVADSERCRVVYARGIAQPAAHALARECDAHVLQQERYFEISGPERVTVYLFESSSQKAWLMGAREVNIAKPWRNEVYLEERGYPHPVLGHEVAHVMAARFGQGPFGVAGPAGGWIPDPGRIEGVAVAASPRADDDLTLAEWARAMRDLDLLPPLAEIFKLSFLGHNSSKAYAVAGAFVDWLRREHGIAAVKAWYGGASLESATGKALSALELDFLSALEEVQVSDKAMAVAKARFDRPALFGRRCPHQIDALASRARRLLGKLDPQAAREAYERVLALDPHDFAAKIGLGICAQGSGELESAEAIFRALLPDETLTAPRRALLHERLGDLAHLRAQPSVAKTEYTQAMALLVSEDELRSLSIKRALLGDDAASSAGKRAVADLLVGDPVLGQSWPVAAEQLGRWSELELSQGLADYLLGKNHFTHGRWDQAARALDAALARKISDPLVTAEALRTRLEVACALGQKQAAEQSYERLRALPDVSRARREWFERFAERCGVGSPVSNARPAPHAGPQP